MKKHEIPLNDEEYDLVRNGQRSMALFKYRLRADAITEGDSRRTK